ncbi:MAG: hypothetical protein ACPGWR_10255 [Ardenticatenaceae bacterium]
MSQIIDILLTDLRSLIADLGKDGGLISPSVYDTAQLLRFCPPEEGVEPALEWILAQQQADGGWGNPAVPLSRHMPTLASVLTLHTYKNNSKAMHNAAQAGTEFLQQHAAEWYDANIDDFPIAVEVILPKLIEDAEELGLKLSKEPYANLIRLGNKKRKKIAQMQPKAGTAPTYSWEAWGTNPTTDVVDEIGSVGTSPAATAAWIHAASRRPDLADIREKTHRYLTNASAATRVNIPGVVPTVWPINYFDQHYGLYALLISGLLNHPALQKEVQSQAKSLAEALQPTGISYCPYFQTDPDCTAVALLVIQSTHTKINPVIMLNQFKDDACFITFPNELNSSILANAHVVHALARFDQQVDQLRQFLCQRQLPDGRWPADKWHGSWVYSTLEAMLALTPFEHTKDMQLVCNAFLSNQHADGGWGIGRKSTSLETAYSVLALNPLRSHGLFKEHVRNSLYRGYNFLLNNYRPFALNEVPYWIGKELYSPYRVDHAFELSAMLAIALEDV